VSNDDLREFFSGFGDVKEAVVLFDNNRGISRCFGFVTFEDKDVVDGLVRQNNFKIKGKQIDIKQALPKSMQKQQNVVSQSAIDVLLNPKAKGLRNRSNINFPDDNLEINDSAFVDYIINPLAKQRENMNAPTDFINQYYNFNIMPGYDFYGKRESLYGPYKSGRSGKVGFKPY